MNGADNDAAIRDRAYEIWEREGRPTGREHEHWAEAAREIEGTGAPAAPADKKAGKASLPSLGAEGMSPVPGRVAPPSPSAGHAGLRPFAARALSPVSQ